MWNLGVVADSTLPSFSPVLAVPPVLQPLEDTGALVEVNADGDVHGARGSP